MKRTTLFLAGWILVAQVAAAVHASRPHSDVASPCANEAGHFCALGEAHDSHPCELCRVSVQGAVGGAEEKTVALQSSEPTVLAQEHPAPSVFLIPSAPPRAPPIG